MGSLGFTLADRLGARSNPCTVRGCTRTWLQMTGRVAKLGGRANASAADPASGMCDPCREKFPQLTEQLRACERPGCEHSWAWSVGDQIEAFAANRGAPHRLCDDCQTRLSALADKEVPCSVPGCERHGIFGKRAQLVAGAPAIEVVPPAMMCGPCANVYEKIKDRLVTCGIQGCKHKWSWGREEQIKDYAAGLPNEPPRRLCESCRGVFGAIADREVRCRTSGCKHTWTWPRETQLNAAVAGKPLPKAPHRMCQRCIDLYSGMKDVERPCRRPGCKRTWTDKRGAQLARAVRGKTGDPYPHYCTECEKELGEMEDRQVPCKTEHCAGTWTWTAAQQLAAGVRPDVKHDGADSGGGPEASAERALTGDVGHRGGRGGGAPRAPVGPVTAPRAASPPATEAPQVPSIQMAAVVSAGSGLAEPAGEAEMADAGDIADIAEASAAAGAEAPPEGESESEIELAPSDAAAAVGPAGSGRKRRRRKRRKEIRPPERRCEDCVAFLKDRKTKEVPCVGCKTTIFWPPESQLQTHLGNWAEPTLCGACKRDLTEAARAAERESLRHGGLPHPAPHPLSGPGADETAPPLPPAVLEVAAAEDLVAPPTETATVSKAADSPVG